MHHSQRPFAQGNTHTRTRERERYMLESKKKVKGRFYARKKAGQHACSTVYACSLRPPPWLMHRRLHKSPCIRSPPLHPPFPAQVHAPFTTTVITAHHHSNLCAPLQGSKTSCRRCSNRCPHDGRRGAMNRDGGSAATAASNATAGRGHVAQHRRAQPLSNVGGGYRSCHEIAPHGAADHPLESGLDRAREATTRGQGRRRHERTTETRSAVADDPVRHRRSRCSTRCPHGGCCCTGCHLSAARDCRTSLAHGAGHHRHRRGRCRSA